MSISLCMIAKNEQNFIGNALRSVENFVDEMIVVDTGSNDNTIEIANHYNAKIIHSQWKKDFSHHRNEAISAATGDWILFLDCDEILTLRGQSTAKQLLQDPENTHKAYNIALTNVISNIPLVTFNAIRIFKNFEGFFFQGPIHEQVITSISQKYDSAYIGELPLTIHHYGYDEAIINLKDKAARNLEILFSITPKNSYFYAMIGDEYLKLNNFNHALVFYEKSLATLKSFKEDYIAMLLINYTSCLINIKKYHETLDFIDYAHRAIPNFRDLYFLEYWALNALGNFSGALNSLNTYISLSKTTKNLMDVKRFDTLYNLATIRYNLIANVMS